MRRGKVSLTPRQKARKARKARKADERAAEWATARGAVVASKR